MKELNSVQKYYENKTIFITGGSGEDFFYTNFHEVFKSCWKFLGFLGKVLIEKLLYSCSDVKQLIVLMRPKRGKNARQRVDDFLKLEASHI